MAQTYGPAVAHIADTLLTNSQVLYAQKANMPDLLADLQAQVAAYHTAHAGAALVDLALGGTGSGTFSCLAIVAPVQNGANEYPILANVTLTAYEAPNLDSLVARVNAAWAAATGQHLVIWSHAATGVAGKYGAIVASQ